MTFLSYYFLCLHVVLLILQLHSSETSAEINKLQAPLPLVINTWAFTEANAAAWKVLNAVPGGNALDALVAGCTRCEQLQCDGTVGYGGSPDERGETTLDALLMNGANMNIGAVANLKEIKDAARVARFVLEHTQHTLLVGEAASDFAEAMGFRRESLATAKSKAKWHEWSLNNCQPNFWINVYPDPRQHCGPYKPLSGYLNNNKCQKERDQHNFGTQHHDTIGMIVIDAKSQIFAGTSTNGATHKIPGRVGDAPIPGAGAYADNEIGAAVATGDGDIMMRFLPSLIAVEFLRVGKTPSEAAQTAMQRILRFYPGFSGGLVVVDRQGHYAAACAGIKRFPFSIVHGNADQQTKVENVDCLTINAEFLK